MNIQRDGTLHSLFYLETALHVTGGTTTHHQQRKQLYLQHLVYMAHTWPVQKYPTFGREKETGLLGALDT